MPQIKDAPKKVNEILEAAYQNCLKEKGYDKERCSKIAYGALKNAGWYKDTDGKWKKKQANANTDNDFFEFSCNAFSFEKETDDEEIYRMTIVIGNRFMKNLYIPMQLLAETYHGFEKTPHDLNHQGTGYASGLAVIPSDVSYVVGYQDNVTFDEKTGEVTASVHIDKNSYRYGEWKSYMNICKKMGRTPNVSMFNQGKIAYVTASQLPENADYKSVGYSRDSMIPVMTEMTPIAVSTVFLGACNDRDGCGIRNSCDNGVCDTPNDDELPDNPEHEERKDYLKKRLNELGR